MRPSTDQTELVETRRRIQELVRTAAMPSHDDVEEFALLEESSSEAPDPDSDVDVGNDQDSEVDGSMQGVDDKNTGEVVQSEDTTEAERDNEEHDDDHSSESGSDKPSGKAEVL